jgi:hypothetical protein
MELRNCGGSWRMVKMKDSTEKDQHITRELGRYRLVPPSSDLHDRVLQAAREALTSGDAELPWPGRWLRACGAFRQEILAFASSLMLILGVVMQFGGNQSALADSLERLTVMASVSGSLKRATSMDCTVLKPHTGDESSLYRIRWNTTGVTRIDLDSTGSTEQMIWISNGTVSVADESGTVCSMAITAMPSKWQPPVEFLTPTILAQNMKRYGLMQAERQDGAVPDEFLFVGQEDQQVIEIAIDAGTFLPKTLKKHLPASAWSNESVYLEEVRFQWNKPVPREVLVPGPPAVQRKAN